MRWAVLTLLFVTVACSSPERKAADAQKSAESWAATAKVTAEEWRRGAVTDGYVRSTARVAIEELSRNAGDMQGPRVLGSSGTEVPRTRGAENPTPALNALRLWRELLDKVQ